jgi:hypothetical protein
MCEIHGAACAPNNSRNFNQAYNQEESSYLQTFNGQYANTPDMTVAKNNIFQIESADAMIFGLFFVAVILICIS